MGRASVALKQVLDTYGISQNKLAVTMGINRANVGHWYHGLDPSAENIALTTEALKTLNIEAAREDDRGTQALMNAFYLALSEGFPRNGL